MKRGKLFLIIIAVIVIGLQFVPVERTNPPVTGEIQAPANVAAVIEKSCYDCHSNETNWPWYSYVAPASWFVTTHVRVGRSDLNFSTWADLTELERADIAHEIFEEVERGEMPLPFYLRAHGDAALSDAARDVLLNWARAMSGGTVD